MQVDDEHLRADDIVLWSDELRWLTGRGHAHVERRPVPLITFGDHCFYRAISEPLLVAAGIDHHVVFSASSVGGVRAALSAGLGVGVLGLRYLEGDLVEWPPGAELPNLPQVHQVARTVPGEAPEMTRLLIEAIAAELVEPS